MRANNLGTLRNYIAQGAISCGERDFSRQAACPLPPHQPTPPLRQPSPTVRFGRGGGRSPTAPRSTLQVRRVLKLLETPLRRGERQRLSSPRGPRRPGGGGRAEPRGGRRRRSYSSKPPLWAAERDAILRIASGDSGQEEAPAEPFESTRRPRSRSLRRTATSSQDLTPVPPDADSPPCPRLCSP